MTLDIMQLFRPNKKDITQIESLCNLKACKNSISQVIGITPETLEKWEKSNSKIRSLFKESSKEKYDINHPDVKDKIELAFEVGIRKYYQYKDTRDLPVGRYQHIHHILNRETLAINPDILKKYVDKFKLYMNGGIKASFIDMGEVWKLINNLDSRLNLAFDPFQFKKLGSVMYFDENEDLSRYDYDYSIEKIKFWEDNNADNFFLSMPMKELIGMRNISDESLASYLMEAEEIVSNIDQILDTSPI